MSTYVMTHGSTEFRRVLITTVDENGTAIDPTGFPVELAFTEHGSSPVEADWQTATWVTATGRHYAKILVGPDGGLDLADTDWWVYARVDAGMEYPFMLAGVLRFQ